MYEGEPCTGSYTYDGLGDGNADNSRTLLEEEEGLLGLYDIFVTIVAIAVLGVGILVVVWECRNFKDTCECLSSGLLVCRMNWYTKSISSKSKRWLVINANSSWHWNWWSREEHMYGTVPAVPRYRYDTKVIHSGSDWCIYRREIEKTRAAFCRWGLKCDRIVTKVKLHTTVLRLSRLYSYELDIDR